MCRISLGALILVIEIEGFVGAKPLILGRHADALSLTLA